MQPCIFCQIIKREIQTTIVMETDDVLVIKDHAPKAPIHYLILPKKHVADIQSLEAADELLAAHMFFVAQRLAKTLAQPHAFKLVSNNGASAGQRVFHWHLHFLSGPLTTDVRGL